MTRNACARPVRGFAEHAVWDFANTRPDQYPLLLHFPYLDIYRKQVVKQADLVLAMQLCPEAFTVAQKQRNFACYEQTTVRDPPCRPPPRP